jgi:hypothetical protein
MPHLLIGIPGTFWKYWSSLTRDGIKLILASGGINLELADGEDFH